MNTKNITMMVISLAIGVVLIAGVVTPIIASTINTSGGGGSTTQEVEFTNEGQGMTKISDIFSNGQRYEIRKMATPTSTALYEYTIYNGDTVVRTEPIVMSDTRLYTILANSEVLIQYRDLKADPQDIELVIMFADDPNSPYTVYTGEASDFALVIGKTGNTDVFSITFNKSGVITRDISAKDGFVVDTEGDWAMISVGENGSYPVKYLDIKDVYSLSSYGVYLYQGGTDSAIATFSSDQIRFSDVTTTGVFGQADVDGHKEFTASLYVEVGGQPAVGTEPHGVTFTATESQAGELTMSCDTYIVPATGKATVEVPSSITNEGPRMSAFNDVIEKYDIRSVYVTEGDSTWADAGSRFLTFYNDNGTLKMGIKTYGDSENTTEEITSITESCVLLSVPDHLIIYNSARNEILYACTDMPVNLRSDSVSSLMDFNIGYDYTRDSTEPVLQYSMVVGQYAGGGELTPTGYLYDTEGDYVSSYGQNPIYYEGNNLIYGFINERRPQGSNAPIIAYLSTGLLIANDDFDTPVVTDNHTTRYGFNYVDSNNTITLDLNNTSLGEEYTGTCNVFIAPRTIGSEGGSGGGVSGSLASMISVIPLIMAVGLVIGAIQYIKMKN